MNGDPRSDQLRVAGAQLERRIDASAQIDARRTVGGVLRKRIVAADAWIEDAQLQTPAAVSLRAVRHAQAPRCASRSALRSALRAAARPRLYWSAPAPACRRASKR